MTYRLGDKDYDNIYSLAEQMYLYTDTLAKDLRKEELSSFLKEKDGEKAEKIRHLSLQSLPDDVFVFLASYVLNPMMSFRFHGLSFPDYPTMGDYMLSFSPSYDPVLLEMVRYSLLSQQMKASGYKALYPEQAERVEKIEKESEKDSAYAYFLLAYELSGKDSFVFDGVSYPDLYSFSFYLSQKNISRSELGETLAHSPILRAYCQYGKDRSISKDYLHLISELEKGEKTLSLFLQKEEKKEGN